MADKKGSFKFEVDYYSDPGRTTDIEFYLSYDKNGYNVSPKYLTSNQKASALSKPSKDPFPVRLLYEYFRVYDLSGTPVSNFHSPITITLKFSPSEWDDASHNSYNRPRVGYLKWTDESGNDKVDDPWLEARWTEFTPNQIISLPPNVNHPEGYLIISFDDLPDPLIGGC